MQDINKTNKTTPKSWAHLAKSHKDDPQGPHCGCREPEPLCIFRLWLWVVQGSWADRTNSSGFLCNVSHLIKTKLHLTSYCWRKAQHCQKATLGERKRGSGYEILKGHHAFLLALCSCTSVCCPPHRIEQHPTSAASVAKPHSGISCSSPLDFEIFEQVARQPQGQFTLVLFCTKIVGSSGCSSQSKKSYFMGFSPFN